MTLRDEHTNCSLLEAGQRVTMSRTGSKRNDNLTRKAWPSIEIEPVFAQESPVDESRIYRAGSWLFNVVFGDRTFPRGMLRHTSDRVYARKTRAEFSVANGYVRSNSGWGQRSHCLLRDASTTTMLLRQ